MFRDQIFNSPAQAMKESLKSEDLFVQDINGKDIALPPPEKSLTKSKCTSLFMCIYKGKKKKQISYKNYSLY